MRCAKSLEVSVESIGFFALPPFLFGNAAAGTAGGAGGGRGSWAGTWLPFVVTGASFEPGGWVARGVAEAILEMGARSGDWARGLADVVASTVGARDQVEIEQLEPKLIADQKVIGTAGGARRDVVDKEALVLL